MTKKSKEQKDKENEDMLKEIKTPEQLLQEFTLKAEKAEI